MEYQTTEEILDEIIISGLDKRASDIHLDPNEYFFNVSFRIDGMLCFQKELPLSIHESIIARIKVLARLPIDDKRLPKDGRFKWVHKQGIQTAEIRVSMMPAVYGENAVLRLFDPLISIFSLKELGFSDQHSFSLEKALTLRSGLIMIVGPTGSGKTTTLYSILDIVKKSSRVIITVEDPIERRIPGIRQIEVGTTTLLEYVTVLRSILRQDPDVIMIGEIRDKESAELAMQSALTGHLVISTLHATSSFSVKNRLMNMGISEYLVDATLICAMSQRLVSKMCNHCKTDDVQSYNYEEWCIEKNIEIVTPFFKKGKGCKECGYKGVSGRVVVSELSTENLFLYDDAHQKALAGIIPFSEVIMIANEYAHG